MAGRLLRPRFIRRPIAAVAALAATAAAVVVFAGAANAAGPEFAFTKIEGAAGSATGLAPTVAAFRALLGEPNNVSGPPAQAGRREINWDGTPDDKSTPNLLPPDFFNTVVPRGAVFASNKGDRFKVSADNDNPTNTPTLFGDINPQYSDIFATFSPQRLFAPIGTTKTNVRFFVPGTEDRATVKGFGAVFTDVDRNNSTKIELFDRHGRRIWWSYVPGGTQASKSLSFLGVKTTADIYEVRITTGNAPLSLSNTDNRMRDIVAMDDFLYSEPQRLS
jgi:hypothetical protein